MADDFIRVYAALRKSGGEVVREFFYPLFLNHVFSPFGKKETDGEQPKLALAVTTVVIRAKSIFPPWINGKSCSFVKCIL